MMMMMKLILLVRVRALALALVLVPVPVPALVRTSSVRLEPLKTANDKCVLWFTYWHNTKKKFTSEEPIYGVAVSKGLVTSAMPKPCFWNIFSMLLTSRPRLSLASIWRRRYFLLHSNASAADSKLWLSKNENFHWNPRPYLSFVCARRDGLLLILMPNTLPFGSCWTLGSGRLAPDVQTEFHTVASGDSDSSLSYLPQT